MTSPDTLRDLLRALPVFAADLPTFDPADTPAAPVALYTQWLEYAIAAGVAEPHAMTLSTVDGDGRADSRVLILKGIVGDAWRIATSATSAKGRELRANPSAALAAYWPAVGRQVRVRGVARPAAPQVSAADFAARSLTARAEALLGRQSQILIDPQAAHAEHADAVARINAEPALVAPQWTVYEIEADTVEFFQARADRWHTRLRYCRTTDGWAKEVLWP